MSSDEREVSTKNEDNKENNQPVNEAAATAPSADAPVAKSGEKEEKPQEQGVWNKFKDQQKKKKNEPEGPNAHVRALSKMEDRFTEFGMDMAESQSKLSKMILAHLARRAGEKWENVRNPKLTEQQKEQRAQQLDDRASQINESEREMSEDGSEMRSFAKKPELQQESDPVEKNADEMAPVSESGAPTPTNETAGVEQVSSDGDLKPEELSPLGGDCLKSRAPLPLFNEKKKNANDSNEAQQKENAGDSVVEPQTPDNIVGSDSGTTTPAA